MRSHFENLYAALGLALALVSGACTPPQSSVGKAIFGEHKTKREREAEEQEARRAKDREDEAQEREANEQAVAAAAAINAANEQRRQEEQAKRDKERKTQEEAAEAEQERLRQQYLDEEARRAADKAFIASLRPKAAEPTYAVPALSAIICDERETIGSHEKDLGRERQIAARSGVTDLSAQRYLGEAIQEGHERIAALQQLLRQHYRTSPKKCSDVRSIVDCAHNDWKCDEPAMTPALLWRHHRDALEDPDSANPG